MEACRVITATKKKKKKSKVIHTSAEKVMLTFIFDQDGPLLIDFLQRRKIMNAQRYS